jgi:hypothetical protein
MAERLSWEEIQQRYNGEWVELIDYDWLDERPYPSAGAVRVHARKRSEFDKLAAVDPPLDSAFVYVGKPQRQPGVYVSANLRRQNFHA